MADKRTPLVWLLLSALALAAITALVRLRPAGVAGGSKLGPSPTLRAAPDVAANASWFDYDPAGGNTAGSAIQYHQGDPGVLQLTVFGAPPKPGSAPTALIYAYLANGTGRTVELSAQAAVHVTVLHGGTVWRELLIDPPASRTLAPEAQVQVSSTMPLGGPGHYDLSAELVSRGDGPAFTFAP